MGAILRLGFIYLISINGLAIFINCYDKFAAKFSKYLPKALSRRVSEQTLHLVELLGGSPASYLIQQMIRHKTQKQSYRRTSSFIMIFQLVLFIAMFWAVR
ncbi:unnamed protein product [Heterosigma akashiwo]|mmetsp:Transcript_36897/g.66902  ORF Transcript_36897/g.66902 Transcript_36897/m.66902 type:complete len:101 (+) Transcript_36897:14-316(+)